MAPTLRQRKRYPKLREIALIWRTLAAVVPVDREATLEHGWRESLRGVPNYRFKSSTNGKDWIVDVYSGGYYVVTASDRFPEPCKSIPSLVGYLCRMVGVKPALKRQPPN